MKQLKLNSTSSPQQESEVSALRKRWNEWLDRSQQQVTDFRETCQSYLKQWAVRDFRQVWRHNFSRRAAQVALSSGLLLSLAGEAEAQTPQVCPPNIEFERVPNDIFNDEIPIETFVAGNTYTYAGGNPSLVDIDGDGDLDMFVGTNAGGIKFFENTGTAQEPIFANPAENNPFGISVPTEYSYNTTTDLVDIDGDGDLDLFVGNYYGAAGGTILFFENTGSTSAPSFAAPTVNPFDLGPFFGGKGGAYYTDPEFVDIDGDGDLDVFVSDKKGYTYFQENIGSAAAPDFDTPQLAPFGLPTFFGYYGSFEAADIDGDGDFDLFADGGGGIIFFRNDGSATAPAFTYVDADVYNIDADGGTYAKPVLGDLDGDGDLDFVTGVGFGQGLIFKENQGNAQNPNFSPVIFGLPQAVADAATTFADLDGDGDMDALFGGYNGYLYFGENLGNDSFRYSEINPFGSYYIGKNAHPELADIDGDGDLDAFVGTKKYDQTYVFENTGTTTAPDFSTGLQTFGIPARPNPSPGYPYVTPELVDVDGDGDLDLFSGGFDGNTYFVENTGSATAPSFGAWQINPFGITGNSIDPTGDVPAYENSVVTFADVDFDGDQDLFAGGFYTANTLLAENTGGANAPVFDGFVANPFGISPVENIVTAPEMTNFDGDIDQDLFVGMNTGDVAYFRNNTVVPPIVSVRAIRNAEEGGQSGLFRIELEYPPFVTDPSLLPPVDLLFFVGSENTALGEDFTISAGTNVTNFDPIQRTLTIAQGATFAEVVVNARSNPSVDENTVTLTIRDESELYCRSNEAPLATIDIVDLQGLDLKAVPGNESVVLTWDNLTGCSVRNSVIYMGASPDNVNERVGTVNGSEQRFRVTGLINGLAYYFRVVSNCSDGQVESQVVRAQPSIISSTEDLGEEALTLHPNPSSGLIKVRLPEALSTDAIVTVIDMTGRQVTQQNVAGTNDEISVDLSNVAQGMYILQVQSGDKVARKRVIIK